VSVVMMQVALDYLSKGFSIIPIKPDKKPFIRWEPYQKQKATPEEIREWWTKWPTAMIGIVTGSISGVVVIDVDDPDKGMQTLSEYLTTGKVPTATTPGGGYHFYFKAPEKCPGNSAGTPPGVDFRGEGGYIIAPPSQNGTGKGYAFLDGLSLQDVELPPLPRPYILLINSFKHSLYMERGVNDAKRPQVTPSDAMMFIEGRRDEDLFHVANCLVKGGTTEKETLKVLEILALNCEPPFPLQEIPEKLDSALKRAKRREVNVSEEVRDFVMTSRDAFMTSDVAIGRQLTSREDRKAIVKALLRFEKEGLIEHCGNRNGCYRRIESQCEDIDFLNASEEGVNLRWPFEIERYVRILPKNIVVIAGTPDAGKTAFLLNVVKENMQGHKIHYFSSEMGAVEIKDRLRKFGLPLNDWKRCTFKERSSNFSDVIQPDGINVIDFIEIHDEFCRVGGLIKEIYDKLTTGIAVIALQKKPGQDLGRGGLGTLEKPRLYLAIDNGKIKIVKAKNWVNSQVNPNGLEVSFKLVDGCKFRKIGDWDKSVEVPGLYKETPNQFKYTKKRMGKEDLTREFQNILPNK